MVTVKAHELSSTYECFYGFYLPTCFYSMKTYYPILENVDETEFSRRVLFEREGGEVCIYSPDRENRGTAVSLEAQSKIYAVRDCRLTAVEAHEILQNVDEKKFSKQAPFKPAGGEMYIYSQDNADQHTADGYRWQSSTGFVPLPSKAKALVSRKAKKIITAESGPKGDGRFTVYVFKLLMKPSPLLVHYVGDCSIYKPLPHKKKVVTALLYYVPFYQLIGTITVPNMV